MHLTFRILGLCLDSLLHVFVTISKQVGKYQVSVQAVISEVCVEQRQERVQIQVTSTS